MRNVRPTQRSLIVRKAGVVAFAMYAARKYLAARGAPSDREDLKRHQLIAYRDAVAYVDAYRWTNALSDRVAFRATDATSMLDAVVAGLGIGVLPCFLAQGAPDVVCLQDVGPPAPEVILARHPSRHGGDRPRTRRHPVAARALRAQRGHAGRTCTSTHRRVSAGSPQPWTPEMHLRRLEIISARARRTGGR